MYKIENDCVYDVIEINTTKSNIIEKMIGFSNSIVVEVEKTNLSLHEKILITFKHQKFDVESGVYVDIESNKEIKVKIKDFDVITLTPINGSESLEFSSAEPGTYVIKSINDLTNNAEVEVIVNG